MKILNSLFAIVALSTTGVAQAETQGHDVKFSYSSFYSAYSCDYAEKQTMTYLQAMGAHVVSVTCNGGLPWNKHLSVKASFHTAAEMGATTYQTVTLASRESCDFNETIVKELLPHFQVQNLKGNSSCWHSQGRFSYTFDVLK